MEWNDKMELGLVVVALKYEAYKWNSTKLTQKVALVAAAELIRDRALECFRSCAVIDANNAQKSSIGRRHRSGRSMF